MHCYTKINFDRQYKIIICYKNNKNNDNLINNNMEQIKCNLWHLELINSHGGRRAMPFSTLG